jgi:glycosyltransferase involved in cell wall biosynthesis
MDVVRGSGTFSGVSTLARAVRKHGCEVSFFTPGLHLPVYTLERLWFNEQLRRRDFSGFDAVVGYDMDGYRVRTGRPHIASIKGVIADEMRFGGGLTRRTMSVQAACERMHVRRAGTVITTSRFAASRIQELYGLAESPVVVPEAIDLEAWRGLFARNPATPDPERFTLLTVCRFYPRKRLNVLLGAAARVRERLPSLSIRIVGGGPEAKRLRRISTEQRLGGVVHWLGDISQDELAREYQRCDVFCLPSVQEGFGIVFLEAMAAGKPIIAARAAAAPEVVTEGLLAEPDDTGTLAAAIAELSADAGRRRSLGEAGLRAVRQYDAPGVAQLFLDTVNAAVSRYRR